MVHGVSYRDAVVCNVALFCVLCYRRQYMTPKVLDDSYRITPVSGTYYVPQDGELDSYREYLRSLPATEAPEVSVTHTHTHIHPDTYTHTIRCPLSTLYLSPATCCPHLGLVICIHACVMHMCLRCVFVCVCVCVSSLQVFGMHPNSNISFQLQETRKLIDTIVSIQPRVTGSATGKSSDELVAELAAQLEAELPQPLLRSEAAAGLFERTETGQLKSLSVVIGQVRGYATLVTHL